MRPRRLFFQDASDNILKTTHQLFRYPAKFHPPVARHLIERYSKTGDCLLDPFCGSGTLSVESSILGRDSVGIDIDPVAVFVSKVKTRRIPWQRLQNSWENLRREIKDLARTEREYERRQFSDIAESTLHRNVQEERLWVPEIPNIEHWFRRYVIVDLARLLQCIETIDVPHPHREFFLLCFAAIIRGASNADPVPVSGLEVTSHMRRKDEVGRTIDPFSLFRLRVEKNISGAREFYDHTDGQSDVRIYSGDATRLSKKVKRNVDAVITSPPYHSAVDYYRRHKLEMFWLGLTDTHQDRLALLPKYIGSHKVRKSHAFLADCRQLPPYVVSWDKKIRLVSEERANAFRHYSVAMSKMIEELANILPSHAPVVLVVGHSQWGNQKISTSRLFREVSAEWFELEERLWYPIKNRYMSYTRHNGASINREQVLVLRRRS